MFDYFSYLRLLGLEDTKQNFIDYLMEVNGDNYEDSKSMADFMYGKDEV